LLAKIADQNETPGFKPQWRTFRTFFVRMQ
jgi:hypothetical protein